MTTYLVRRLLLALVTLLAVTMLVYGLIRNMPGTPLTIAGENMDPSKRISEADYKLMEKVYGLDLPWHRAYFAWIGNVLRGDLSTSFRERRPVTAVIGQRIGPTLLLGGLALLLQYLISVPIGLYSTVRSGKWDERALSVCLYVLYSLPTYVAALSLLLVFYLYLKDTPWQLKPGMVSDNYAELSATGKTLDIARHLILPLVCFTYGGLAYFSRFVKANMEEAIRQDYIRTARAKGAGPLRVLIHHAFRNTLIPLVTLLGLTLPGILSGSIILEQIFSWPGMGMLFFEALSVRDYPVIMGLTFLFSILTLSGQLLADLLYAAVDPRVTYGKS
jgi:peptide/nickel transport system permease protein